MKKLIAAAVGATALLTVSGAAAAATLTVCPSGCQYTTLAAALAAAHDGDTIAIGPGTYSGGFTITASVRLTGAGRNMTTISGGGPVVRIARGASVKISKVTISGGSATVHGAGIDNDGSLWLYETRISDNHVGFEMFGGVGGGIFNDGGQLRVEKSTVSGNSATDGGGIRNEGGTVVVIRSLISNNTAEQFITGFAALGTGAGISNNATLFVVKSQLVGNHGEGQSPQGGGIWNESAGTATIRESWVTVNSLRTRFGSSDGAGLWNAGSMTLNETAVSWNTAVGDGAPADGAGIFNSGALSVTKGALSNNTAHGLNGVGGGILNAGDARASFRSTPITGNTASAEFEGGQSLGGGIANIGSLTLLKSPVSGNAAIGSINFEASGGGIWNTLATSLHRIDSPVTGNTPDNCVGC